MPRKRSRAKPAQGDRNCQHATSKRSRGCAATRASVPGIPPTPAEYHDQGSVESKTTYTEAIAHSPNGAVDGTHPYEYDDGATTDEYDAYSPMDLDAEALIRTNVRTLAALNKGYPYDEGSTDECEAGTPSAPAM